jgi:ABC-type Zn uptake system ZnuABC Zn-binding protein ZnuA
VWVASHGLPLRTGDSSEPAGDPHWWHDPTLFERAATALGERLASIDPAHADAYRANASSYVTRIQAMDAANTRLIATVPRGERKLVTNHDAFGYFAAHYGITVVGSVLPSLSTVAQPSAKDVVDLIGKIRAEHVRAIFTESSLNPALEQQIASEAGVKVYANLYGDTLGPPGSPGATYIGMERWNMRAMVAGFLGTPPPQA